MKTKLNISDILDYAYKSGVVIDKSDFSDVPENYKSDLIKNRIEEEWVEDWGFYDKAGDLVAIAGNQPINEFTTEVWGEAFDNSYRKTVLKTFKMFCDLWIQDYQRLQSLINENNQKALRFNKLLGLEEEALLENYTEDNWYLLRRLRHD